MITEIDKYKITEVAKEYVARHDSQRLAAGTLKGVSTATLNHVINHRWQHISDDMWRTLVAGLNYNPERWQAVETRDYKTLYALLTDAQDNSLTMAVIGEAGSGKTFTMRHFAKERPKVYLLHCSEYWNRKWFLMELLIKMGRPYSGLTVAEMMSEVVRRLRMVDHPIIVLDEADKLTDQVLCFFITLYNQLEGRCGIVMCATNHLEKHIRRGLNLNKKGYKEIFSRLGRKFIELKGVSATDIHQVCFANDIADKNLIKEVIEDSEWDLRRVKRKIHALKSKMQQQEQQKG